jgi:hypothetical protein
MLSKITFTSRYVGDDVLDLLVRPSDFAEEGGSKI